MLDRLRDLWAERPAVVAAALIAPIAFVLTLVILLIAVGGGGSDAPQAQSVSQETQGDPDAQQQTTSQRQDTTIIVETSADEEDQSVAQVEQSTSDQDTQADPSQQDTTQAAAEQDDAESDQQQSAEQEAVAEVRVPEEIAGLPVQPLDEVLDEGLDEDSLRHGTDGSEGGILPIDNGVVVSSGEEHQTTWELIVPSAGLKSSIVKVGRTQTGAMGSPDNPYVIGWLDSSAVPGEAGNALLAGHRDFEDISGNVGTGVCWELVNTVVGDQMILRDNELNIYYVYTVTEAATVNPRDPDSARYLKNTDESIITLITCEGSFNAETHQYSHRRVVVGVLAAVASPDA